MQTVEQLRRAPTAAALAAFGEAIAPGSRVTTVRRLRGGIATGMHAVQLALPGGERRWVVLRRYSAEQVEYDPQVCQREWQTLMLLERYRLPAPRPLWLDAEGLMFGGPAMAVTRLPGRGTLAPRDVGAWLRQLAGTLAALHQSSIPAAELSFLPDMDTVLERQLREKGQELGEQDELANRLWMAIEREWPSARSAEMRLLHGDYWPGNTLWQRGRLTGVVDWEQAERGDPAADVAYCRLDISLLFGLEAADSFLREYEAAAGRKLTNLVFWDVNASTRPLPDPVRWLPGYHDLGRTDLTPDTVRAHFRAFAERALAQAR